MRNIIGQGYVNTSEIMTSTANQLIVTDLPTKKSIYRIDLYNYSDCHIAIIGFNNEVLSTLFIKANVGWSMYATDRMIKNIKIVEAGVQYNYYGAYTGDLS